MRRIRAVVIDGRRLIKNAAAAAICVVIASLAALNVRIAGKDFGLKNSMTAESILGDSVPAVAAADGEDGGMHSFFGKLLTFALTFDPNDMRTVLAAEVPSVKVSQTGALAVMSDSGAVSAYNPQNADTGGGEPNPAMPQGGEYPIKAIDSGQNAALGKGKILIRNETDFGIDIDEMLSAPLTFDMKGEGPKVLILHTHATESYSPEGAAVYSPDKSDRTLDTNENVVRVGDAVQAVFEKKGISAIHDTTLHDHPNFNGSYANSLKTVEMYKAKYPGICVVFDIHRDAFVYDDGSKAKFVTNIGGKTAAQLMLVVGTNAGGLEHPNWRENMKLALKLQNSISKKYPTLMRGVNLRKERFNGHTTCGSLIIEVGSSGNSLSEALTGAELGAEAIADFLNTLK